MVKSKNTLKVLSLLFLFVMLASLTSAFSLSYPLELLDRQLELNKKETVDLTFYLQLSALETGEAAQIDILQGNDLITLQGPSIVNVSSTQATPITFTVELPKKARFNKPNNVELLFTKIDSQNPNGLSIKFSFDVIAINPHGKK